MLAQNQDRDEKLEAIATRVRVHRDGPGQGATLTLELPLQGKTLPHEH